MNRKISLIITICTIAILTINLSSCTSSTTKPPDGFEIGEVKPYIGINKTEKNLISQINTYTSALLRNDIENSSKYLYPDVINYYKKINPKEYSLNELRNKIFQISASSIIKMDSIYSKSGVDFSILVCDIDKKIEIGQNKFYIFNLIFQLYREDAKKIKFLHSISDSESKTIGISLNNGKNWTFMAYNDNTPNILRLKFSDEIINQVMGY